MTIQITVRLPDAAVAFVDGLVESGEVASRAAAVAEALRREQRRRDAEHDAAIYAAIVDDPDPVLEAWTAHASRTPMPELD